MDKTYDHLTEQQREDIADTARAEMIEQASQDQGYLIGMIDLLVFHTSTEEHLDTISDDPEMQAEILGFYPETGQEHSETGKGT